MKRFMDLFLVIISFPFWITILLITACVVWAVMGRPVFFRQERPGLKGKPFFLLKFRTMLDGEGSDAERLTRFGRLLRSTSLDELPELLNVLKGEMSLVGPRPLLMRYLKLYTPEQMRRHDVLPGITGWAQIHGRNLISWEQKFAYDLWYVEHHTVALDLKILFRTFGQVFQRKGIHAPQEATIAEFKGSPENEKKEVKL